MAPYNALLKELPAGNQNQYKITGRIFLKDLTQVPENWTVIFRGSSVSRDADIAKLMCTPKDPLVIYKGPVAPKVRRASIPIVVTVVTLIGKAIKIETHESDSVEKLKFLIKEKEGIPVDQLRIIYNGRQLEGGRLLRDYKIEDKSTIHLVLRFRGGGTFTGQDVEQDQVDGVGVPTNHIWKAYGRGMNLVGECPNANCESRGQRVGQREVIYQAGYGEILLTPDRFTFPCPACPYNDASPFPVSKFVLSEGRSLFCFKKSGVGNEVKTVVLESSGSLEEYKTFDGGSGQSLSTYDFIEITTVGPEASFHYCVWCDERIEEVDDEVILSCGHPYHKSTCATSMTNCVVCQSTPIDSLYYLVTLNNGEAGESGSDNDEDGTDGARKTD